MEELQKVEIKRVLPTPSAPAVILGNDDKTFLVFVGVPEASAIMREMQGQPADRPMTHDLIQSVFLGFDLNIRQVIVSKIVDNAFCATLILEQKVTEKNGDWVGRRNEVRIDARPSDCMVLALKNRCDIYVTKEVFDQVQDISDLALAATPGVGPAESGDEDEVVSIDFEGLGEPFEGRSSDLGEEEEEDTDDDES